MIEIYTIESKGQHRDWEPLKLDVFGGKPLLAVTDNLDEARSKMNGLRSYDKTYHIQREYRIVKATTTFEVLND